MTFPTIETVSQNSTIGGLSHAITLPSGIQEGDLLLVFFATDGDNTITDWQAFTELDSDSNSSASFFAVGYKIATAINSLTITVSSYEPASHIVYRISGHDSGQIPEISTVAKLATEFPDPSTLSPTGGAKDYLWIHSAGWDRDRTVVSWEANFTLERTYETGGGSQSCSTAVSGRNENVASKNPAAIEISNGDQWLAFTVVVHPEAGATFSFDLNSDIRFFGPVSFDKTSDIRFALAVFQASFDLNSDIRFQDTYSFDLNSDIRFKGEVYFEKNSDIRFKDTFSFDLTSDIRFVATVSFDLTSDIRFFGAVSFDKTSDIRFKDTFSFDLTSDIRFVETISFDLNSDIRFKGKVSFDLTSNIVFFGQVSFDLTSNIRFVASVPVSFDLTSDIRFFGQVSFDLTSDIRFQGTFSFDLNSDIRFLGIFSFDLTSDIRFLGIFSFDLTSDIRFFGVVSFTLTSDIKFSPAAFTASFDLTSDIRFKFVGSFDLTSNIKFVYDVIIDLHKITITISKSNEIIMVAEKSSNINIELEKHNEIIMIAEKEGIER